MHRLFYQSFMRQVLILKYLVCQTCCTVFLLLIIIIFLILMYGNPKNDTKMQIKKQKFHKI